MNEKLHDVTSLFKEAVYGIYLLLALRLFTFLMLVVLLSVHIRSVRVFRWEQSVSGGLLVTFCFASLGLVFCTHTKSGGKTLQVYLCCMGAILLSLNAAVIWQRWHTANSITRVVAELLESMGVPLQKHVILKVVLSVTAALCMFLDVVLAPMLRG